MNNLKIRKRITKIIATGLTVILLATGCSSKENDAEPVTNDTTTTMEDNSTNNQDVANENTTNEQFDNFASQREEIDSLIYTENFELLNQVYGDYLVDAIDFIRGEKTYQETKFSDLNPEAQNQVIKELINTTNKVESKYPNIKEDLATIKGTTVEAYYNVLKEIEDLIGTENYNNIGELINSIIDGGKNIGNEMADTIQEYIRNHK